jgi:hypothetical protein
MSGRSKIVGMGAGIPSQTIALALAKSEVGCALAVHLSEDSASRAVWTFRVEAQTSEGKRVLGIFTTRPPVGGDPPSRTVALCFCPGAESWKIDSQGPQGAIADITLSTSKLSVAGVFAVVPANGSRLSQKIYVPPVFGATQGILSPGPGTLFKAFGWVDPAQPLMFVGMVDTAIPVVGGDLWRVAPVQILAASGANFGFNFEPEGVNFLLQIRWAASSTAGFVTLGPVATMQGAAG